MKNRGRDSHGLTLRTIFMSRAALDASIALEDHCMRAGLHPAEAAFWLFEYADRAFWIDVHYYLAALAKSEHRTAIEVMIKHDEHRIFDATADISRLPRSRVQIQDDLDVCVPF